MKAGGTERSRFYGSDDGRVLDARHIFASLQHGYRAPAQSTQQGAYHEFGAMGDCTASAPLGASQEPPRPIRADLPAPSAEWRIHMSGKCLAWAFVLTLAGVIGTFAVLGALAALVRLAR